MGLLGPFSYPQSPFPEFESVSKFSQICHPDLSDRFFFRFGDLFQEPDSVWWSFKSARSLAAKNGGGKVGGNSLRDAIPRKMFAYASPSLIREGKIISERFCLFSFSLLSFDYCREWILMKIQANESGGHMLSRLARIGLFLLYRLSLISQMEINMHHCRLQAVINS